MPRKQLPIGSRKPALGPGELPSADKPIDITSKFMRENPKGSLADEPEMVQQADGSFAEDKFKADAPAADAGADNQPKSQSQDTPDTAVADTPAQPDTVQGGIESPQGSPQQAKLGKDASTSQPQDEDTKPRVVAQGAKTPSYDPQEKIDLLAGNEPWTREQIVAGLQDRATLQPKAEENDKFRALFGGDYSEAEARWKPVLQKLQENPKRTQFLEAVLGNADPGLLDYLITSERFYRTGSVDDAPAAQQPSVEQPKVAESPEFQRMARVAQAMERQLITNRVQSEWAQVYQKYPFVQNNQKIRDALRTAAAELYTADEKGGKSPLECRGLLDAMQQQGAFLEMMAIAEQNKNAVNPAAIEPKPNVGAEALLPSKGPGASVANRPAPPQAYHGTNKDQFGGDPIRAFLSDFPE